MEQIQIRQPKMPAAQSFIQILEINLATLFIFKAAYFSSVKIASLIRKQLEPLVTLVLTLKKVTSFSKGRNVQGA